MRATVAALVSGQRITATLRVPGTPDTWQATGPVTRTNQLQGSAVFLGTVLLGHALWVNPYLLSIEVE